MQNNELYELVKSLNKNEKRYISLHAEKINGSRIYLNLFTALEKSRDFNEKDFRKKYSKDNFTRNYAYNKHYLYNLIIKCLANYNNEKSVDAKIHTMIMQCKLLFDKALYRQYFKSIQKAKKYALKHERYGYVLQILDIEKIIIKKEELQGTKANSIYAEALSAINNITSMFQYSLLASNLLTNYRAHGIKRNEEHDTLITNILDNKLMSADAEKLCSRAKESFYRVHEIINETRADYPRMLTAQMRRYDTVRENPDAFKDYILNYSLDVLESLMYTTMKLGKTDETENYIKMYKNSVTEGSPEYGDSMVFCSLIEFQMYLKKTDYKKAKSCIPVLEKILIRYHNKMLVDTELSIRYHIVKYYILVKDFQKALVSVNSLMAHPFIDKRADYESYLKILNLIIHFELGNYNLLRYLIISTYRFLYKRKKLYRLEMVILDFIRKLPGVKNGEDLSFSFMKFRQRLNELKSDDYEKNAFEYFDFLTWIDDKTKMS